MISVSHFCIGNASLRPEMSSLSEQLLRAITCGKISETNLQLHLALAHNLVSEEFNMLLGARGITMTVSESRPQPMPDFIHLEMYVAADKKAVDAMRGCSQCCTWCSCSELLRLTLPMSTSSPPMSWDGPNGADALLDKVCRHPFPSIPGIFAAAHLPIPGGSPLPRRCRFCKQVPFASMEEFDSAKRQ
eukprot:5005264-Pleurochrysis_carterae.AAC.7